MVWSNAQAGATYIVQTATSLLGGTNWVDYVQLPTTNIVNTNLLMDFNPPPGMALIPAGVFTMGNSVGDPDLSPVNPSPTNVMVSAFYMDETLVSYGQWQSVFNWATNHGYVFDDTGEGNAADYPVEAVNWYDCVKWCNARSQREGLTPVYYTDGALTDLYTNGELEISNADVNWTANGYRLPTEAEWEKAARGGLIGKRFPWGNTISESRANYYGATDQFSYDLGPSDTNPAFTNTYPYTSPVRYFAPNGYGLYDMAGNVQEWCWDYTYTTPYEGGTDPRGPDSSTTRWRVLRGGIWNTVAELARCARRNAGDPSFPNNHSNGFRCVRAF